MTDPTLHLLVEKGIRGGVSMITTRYSQANNKYMKSYDPSQESKYIIYLDCNSLYSTAMLEPLPHSGIRWSDWETYRNNKNKNIGYFLEVDLEYPDELHNLHNDYPLAPEKMNGKLIPNLLPKTKYVLHYKALEKYLDLGMKIKSVGRVIQFNQSAWLAPYVQFNINKRVQTTNSFEIQFYKDLNNSLFGKTMENQRKYKNIRLVLESGLEKYVRMNSFCTTKEFDNNLHLVHLLKLTVQLTKPIYLGMSILDLSKITMYEFHYDYMSKFPNKKLLFTDTDSLCYEIVTDDFYREILPDLTERFDTSNYNPELNTHFLYTKDNYKKTGKFSDELGGKILFEFVGLKPKCYAFITDDWVLKNEEDRRRLEKKVCKGVDRATIKHLMRYSDYVKCLKTNTTLEREVTRINSKNHHLTTVSSHKIVLSADDDKRVPIQDSFHTLAIGHYSLREL